MIALGEELSGRGYGSEYAADKALRVLADHTRAATFLIADGVVPSNEDRGYVLRRVIRRTIQHGRQIGLEPGFLPRYADRVIELMGSGYAELAPQRELVHRWLAAEEDSFGRTLELGLRRLDELIQRTRDSGAEGISGADAFLLHDTYGFPIDMTLEIVAEHDLGVDESGFESLMNDQRTRARAGAGRGHEPAAAVSGPRRWPARRALRRSSSAMRAPTPRRRSAPSPRRAIRSSSNSWSRRSTPPAAARSPTSARWSARAAAAAPTVVDVVRLGTDQIVALAPEHGTFAPGERVHAHVDRSVRHATACNHTATHLLHASLRRRLGDHVHQAGSYVGPDKLRFDFTHSGGMSAEQIAAVEDDVNRWILESSSGPRDLNDAG